MPTSKNKPSKHPRKMTTDEAVKHLFHPEVVEHFKDQTDKKATKQQKKG